MEPVNTQKLLGSISISPDILEMVKKGVKNIIGFRKVVEENLELKTSDVIDIIFSGSIGLGASDIHFEPQETQGRLRVRLDGILQDVLLFDLKIYQGLISRIKLLSKVKLNITDKPQDGRFHTNR